MADLTQFPYVLANGPGNLPDADQVMADLQHLRTYVNSALDADNITAGTLSPSRIAAGSLPLSVLAGGTGSDQRGKSIIATEEARTNTAYGLLTTPDRVSSVVLPTDGLLLIGYTALVKSSATAGSAAIFIGSNQLKARIDPATGGPQAQEVTGIAVSYRALSSGAGGLNAASGAGGGDVSSNVTTGQILGSASDTIGNSDSAGFCVVFAAAGTYDITVQFKASSGSVTAKERKLWVEARGF